jgi:hypothetical protein
MDATFEYRQNIFISFLSDGPVQYRDIDVNYTWKQRKKKTTRNLFNYVRDMFDISHHKRVQKCETIFTAAKK